VVSWVREEELVLNREAASAVSALVPSSEAVLDASKSTAEGSLAAGNGRGGCLGDLLGGARVDREAARRFGRMAVPNVGVEDPASETRGDAAGDDSGV
jgi:hypothetical protein